MTTIDNYARLVVDRKACRLCEGLTNPAQVEAGRYDSSEIGPWTRWQGSLSARLMVVGQDWGGLPYFTGHCGRESVGNRTNRNLRELIGLLGIDVGEPENPGTSGQAFFTNAILCLKEGGLQAEVRDAWFRNCGTHLRRQVELVAPRVLVCLGERAYRSVARAFGLRAGPFRAAVESPGGVLLSNGTLAFPRYHCGARIQNTHRSLEVQRQDWLRLKPFLHAPPDAEAPRARVA